MPDFQAGILNKVLLLGRKLCSSVPKLSNVRLNAAFAPMRFEAAKASTFRLQCVFIIIEPLAVKFNIGFGVQIMY